MLTSQDLKWLDAAVRLAMPYRGTTAENPTVGALVVSTDSVLLGRGVTAFGGRPHAEPQALEQAGAASRGAALYVTLEPCHHWGKTPPCVSAVIDAGIRRVVIGMRDPDPRTSGKSIDMLRASGIEVEVLSHHKPTLELHEGFISRITHNRPFLTAKLAVSADDKIGLPNIPNVRVTGARAKSWTFMQRVFSDAIIIGSTTAYVDNPKLNVRVSGLENRSPKPYILGKKRNISTKLCIELNSKNPATFINPHKIGLITALEQISRDGINSALVEGGPTLLNAMLEQGLIDRFHLLQSDRVIGEHGIPTTTHGTLKARLLDFGFVEVDKRNLECDILTTYELQKAKAEH